MRSSVENKTERHIFSKALAVKWPLRGLKEVQNHLIATWGLWRGGGFQGSTKEIHWLKTFGLLKGKTPPGDSKAPTPLADLIPFEAFRELPAVPSEGVNPWQVEIPGKLRLPSCPEATSLEVSWRAVWDQRGIRKHHPLGGVLFGF